MVLKIDPIALFMQEHATTLLHLSALNRASRSLRDNGFTSDAFTRLGNAVAFLHNEVGDHNTREEEALFPVLDRYVEGPTAVMRKEHKVLRRELKHLEVATRTLERRKTSKRALKAACTQSHVVIQEFVNHIHKENNILFPLVQKFLTKDALREIARRMV